MRRVLHCHQSCIPSCHHSAFRGCLAFECELAVNTRPPTRHKTRNIYRCRASTTPSTNTSSGALRTWPHVGQCGRPVAIHDPQSTRRAARARPGSWVLALDRAHFCEKRHAPTEHRQLIFEKVSSSESPHPERTDGVASFTCVLSVEVKTLNTYRKISRQIRPPIHPRPPPRPRPPDGAAPEAAPLVPACVS